MLHWNFNQISGDSLCRHHCVCVCVIRGNKRRVCDDCSRDDNKVTDATCMLAQKQDLVS